jgi:hypothetical protein
MGLKPSRGVSPLRMLRYKADVPPVAISSDASPSLHQDRGIVSAVCAKGEEGRAQWEEACGGTTLVSLGILDRFFFKNL